MATAASVVYSHITKHPGVRGGKACIDDTRVSVVDVVVLLKQGLDAQQIVAADLAEDDDTEADHERRKTEYLSSSR